VFGLFLALMLIDGLLLTVVVLLQSGKGDGLAGMGGGMGTENLIGGRQAATILTKTTWTTGSLFLFLALTLAVMSSRAQKPSSILKDEFKRTAAPVQPSPVQIPGTQPGAGQPAAGAAATPAATAPAATPPANQPKK
jgi:preprotein translocase subunit SecG